MNEAASEDDALKGYEEEIQGIDTKMEELEKMKIPTEEEVINTAFDKLKQMVENMGVKE